MTPLERLEQAEKILCDVDGCLISGDIVLPGARALIERFGHKLALVSNNSTDTSQTLSTRLVGMGLPVEPQRIFLAGESAVNALAAQKPGARVLALANARMRDLCRANGLEVVEDTPDAVLICRDTDLSFARLETALIHVARGVPVVLANRDLSHPGPNGPAIETGALYGLITSITPVNLWMEIGKPCAPLFEAALGGTDPERAVLIGDNPDTDLRGAQAAGIACLLVGPKSPEGLASVDDLLAPTTGK